jgi:hypothetical protein
MCKEFNFFYITIFSAALMMKKSFHRILVVTLTINELSSAAAHPRNILKRQINPISGTDFQTMLEIAVNFTFVYFVTEFSTGVLTVAPQVLAESSKSNEGLVQSSTSTFFAAPEALKSNNSKAPSQILETSVIIETKSSHTVFPG